MRNLSRWMANYVHVMGVPGSTASYLALTVDAASPAKRFHRRHDV
jgi:hypothetical protein